MKRVAKSGQLYRSDYKKSIESLSALVYLVAKGRSGSDGIAFAKERTLRNVLLDIAKELDIDMETSTPEREV